LNQNNQNDSKSNFLDQGELDSLRVQRDLAEIWGRLSLNKAPADVHIMASIHQAVDLVAKLGCRSTNHCNVLTTGSLHLVGGVMDVAQLPVD